jgi:hypothetical protein
MNICPSISSDILIEDVWKQDRYIEDVKQIVQYGDFIYQKNDWDGAPVVIEEFRLLFFTSAKVACTTWKQLFRRMMG